GKSPGFETIRLDFPPLHKLRAYMDTAFVGLMPKQVKAAHEDFLEERLQFGPFPLEKTILGVWLDKTEEVRKKLALFLGAKESEIAFTYCTGCGSNIALNGIDWKKGDNAVIDDLEYPTDFHILNVLRKKGVEIRIARHENGAVSPEKFEGLADKRTRAFVVSHVSYLNGFRHDLKKLADIVHAYGGYLVVDSAQSIGGIKINVRDEDVDFMSGIPYKWLIGPNGLGFLYVREELVPLIAPDRLGWASTNDFTSLDTMESNPLPDTARRYEYGTLGFESVYGLNASLDYINRIGMDAIEQRNLKLIHMLRERLRSQKVMFFTPEENRSPILTFFTDNERAFGKKMKENKILITARRKKKGQVRLSPHFYNNEEDIEAFMRTFSRI
ncbi:MAG: aminotransferase class V-fold PLP-dependent enzyme, partial [Candidatus Aminicenantes bacterium]